MNAFEKTYVITKAADCTLVFRRITQQFFFQPVYVTVQAEFLSAGFKDVKRISVKYRIIFFKRADFTPYLIKEQFFRRTSKPVHSAFKKIAFTLPACRKSAWNNMLFKNCYIKTIPCSIYPGRKPGYSSSNDNQFFHLGFTSCVNLLVWTLPQDHFLYFPTHFVKKQQKLQ